MSFSSAKPIIDQQDKEIREAREKYGEAAGKLMEKHHADDTISRFANGAKSATKSALKGNDPITVTFQGIKGFLLGGKAPPTDEELRNAGRGQRNDQM